MVHDSTPEAKDSGVSISGRIKERAITLGANRVGIASAFVPASDPGGFTEYHEWLSAGKHGEMSYMARSPEVRKDITGWFPPARSVVICAFRYHDGKASTAVPADHGKLARYCLPPDYHDILKGRMMRLLDFCRELRPDCSGKAFADTSPVLERLYARRSGIGWIGKNSMLITRDAGSFLLLAGLALDLDLEVDPPMPDRCGKCRRCVDACPTQALVRSRVLDAARCIAYTTVELRKGPIPEPLREAHGSRIFGCDACQDACPWNRFAKAGEALVPRMEGSQPLPELAELTPESFSRRFKGTPVKRTGHTAFLRNVLLAMGCSRDPRHRKTLERFSAHPDPILSEQARWSLGRLQSDRIHP